jgi:hypothetical protein
MLSDTSVREGAMYRQRLTVKEPIHEVVLDRGECGDRGLRPQLATQHARPCQFGQIEIATMSNAGYHEAESVGAESGPSKPLAREIRRRRSLRAEGLAHAGPCRRAVPSSSERLPTHRSPVSGMVCKSPCLPVHRTTHSVNESAQVGRNPPRSALPRACSIRTSFRCSIAATPHR